MSPPVRGGLLGAFTLGIFLQKPQRRDAVIGLFT